MLQHWNAIAGILWSLAGAIAVYAALETAITNHINRKNAEKQRKWNKKRYKREIELAGRRLQEMDNTVAVANAYWAELQKERKPIRKATGLFSDEVAQNLVK